MLVEACPHPTVDAGFSEERQVVMTDENGGSGEQVERRGARPGPRRGPRKNQFTIRLTSEEEDYLVEGWGWVQAGIEALVRSSLARSLGPPPVPPKPKGKSKKGS